MQGVSPILFSELFADTVRTHGRAWARAYYLARGMAPAEFDIWLSGLLNA